MPRLVRPLAVRLADSSPKLDGVIDGAAQLFYEKGYEGTSMREVAEKVGILKGSLYSHVDSKDDLLFAIVTRTHARFEAALVEEGAEGGDEPLRRLEGTIERYVALMFDNVVHARVYERDWRRLSEGRRQAMRVRRRDFLDRMVALIAEGQDCGAMRDNGPPRLVATVLVNALNSIADWLSPAHHDRAAVEKTVSATLLHGLSAGGRSSTSPRDVTS